MSDESSSTSNEFLGSRERVEKTALSSSPAATTLGWVHNHRVALQAGMIVALFAAGAFVWFAGYLRVLLSRAGDGGQPLSPMIFGAGVAVAVLSTLAESEPMG